MNMVVEWILSILSCVSLKFDFSSYGEWNVVIFVLNSRAFPWLRFEYFYGFCGGLWWN